ncbi:hypothetical protein ZEAMMB73_Zm00001d049936 [Zea mays]|uniref:Uncharacterized protein n=1 Tax=Zea mays TaxID=4577 RepID=A0A1D6PYU1_MAIZE|nr:hypothetical protein ZEAMMB73_Zm00001d049936 [Zea mays]
MMARAEVGGEGRDGVGGATDAEFLAVKLYFLRYAYDPPSDLKDSASTFSPCASGESQEGADTTQNMNDTDKNNSEREESDLALEKESATFTSQKQHLEELSDAKETFIGGPEAEAKSNSTKDFDNPIAKVGSSIASDKMRDGCNANAIPCPVTSNHTTEPSSVASQEASPASTKDTTIPEQVERPSSEELLADVSLPQGKVEPKKTEPAPAASSNIQQHGCKQAGNGNTGTSFNLIHYFS